ncbi:hypothetical protein EV363DRAFT_1449624 [Boletus edulis]|nr:hypothetical protein EV363DRAFT_1449624 [Boletus edulis]
MSDSRPPLRTLQHQLAALESEIQQLKATHVGQTTNNTQWAPWRKRGRALRRLVSFNDNLMDMLLEADRRKEGGPVNHNEEANSIYASYEELRKWVPSLHQWLDTTEDMTALDGVLKHLNEGGDAARSDDACRLKTHVATWLNESHPSNPPLDPFQKLGRGFHSDATGRLLCPAEYDWGSTEHRAKIRDMHPDFVVTANSWPKFLYEDYTYDPTNPSKGLFKGSMSFKVIFTSPSSVDEDHDTPEKRRRAERSTRRNVAQLLKMNKVQPRAIAYVAVQLQFALSSCGAWKPRDDLFDYPTFYNNILKWFQITDDSDEQAFVNDLLLWWNQQIFGRQAVLNYSPQNAEQGSVAASFKRRRIGNAAA